jgi:hypothetical protein
MKSRNSLLLIVNRQDDVDGHGGRGWRGGGQWLVGSVGVSVGVGLSGVLEWRSWRGQWSKISGTNFASGIGNT